MILSVVALTSFFTGCTKIQHLADINVDIPYNQEVSVPQYAGGGGVEGFPIPGGAQLPFPAIPVATNSKAYIAQYGTSAEKVLSVNLKSLELQMLAPEGRNFDFLDNVEVYISGQTLPEMLLASDYSIPKGQTTLVLTTGTDVNLKNYFLQDTIYFRMTAHINSVPYSGTRLNIASVFHMLANPLE